MFAIIADVHLRGKDWEDKKVVLNSLKEDMASKGVKYLLNAGDLFDQGKIGDKYVSAGTIIRWLSDWLSSQPHLAMVSIEGNHDQTSIESAFDLFQHPQQIVVRNEVRWIEIEGHYFICVPWLTQNRVGCDARAFVKEMIKECYSNIWMTQTGKVISINLLGHLDAVGANIRSHVSITSEEYSRYAFDIEKLYNDYDEGMRINNTFLGHIHAKQIVNVDQFGYHGYVGYLAPLGFGETANFNGWCHYAGKYDRAPQFYTLGAPHYFTSAFCEDPAMFEPWDHFRLGGELASVQAEELIKEHKVNPHNVEVISDSLSPETVKDYIEHKDSSFKEVFDKWLEFTDIALDDRSLIDEYIDSLNVRWESLTGRLSRLKSVSLTNIGPHTLTSQAFSDGFTAILGPNSVGKSWIAEALPYAAFGEWITDRGTIAEYMDKGSKVEVIVEIDDREYKIVRTASEMVVYNDKGTALTKELKRSSRAWLEKLIGDKDNFLHCCFVSQQGDYDIIGCDQKDRMHMLRYFLKLDIFDEYLEDIKKSLSGYKALLKAAYDNVSEQGLLEVELDNLIKEKEETSISMVSLLERKYKVSDTISQNLDNYTKSKKYTELITKREMKQGLLADAFQKLVDTREKLTALGAVDEQHRKEMLLFKAEYEEELKKTKALADRYKALRLTMNGSSLDKAGCASSPLPCPFIDKYIDTKKSLDALPPLENTENQAQKLERMIKGIDKELSDIDHISSNASFYVGKIESLEAAILDYEFDIEELTNNIDSLSFTEVDVDIQQLRKEEERLNLDLNLKNRSQGQINAEITNIRGRLLLLNDVQKEIDDLSFKVASFEVLEKAFNKNGISHYIASSALPELQEIFNSLIQISFDDRLKIKFDNITEKGKKVKESFSIIKTNSRKPHDVKHCSGGERAVLRMLWKLTLLIYQSRRNEGYRCLILDEPTAWMDTENIDSTINLLRYVAERFDQIIMVTHDKELAEMADYKVVLK